MNISNFIDPTLLISCPRCHKGNTMKLTEWPGPCGECKTSPEYLRELEEKVKSSAQGELAWGKTPKTDVVAFAKDKQGNTVGIDTKGNPVAIEKTRYNLHSDPHGWRATGKKVSRLDSKGREND